MTFLAKLLTGNKVSERESNPLNTYLSRLIFLADSTPLNKQCFKVNLEFKFHDPVSSS